MSAVIRQGDSVLLVQQQGPGDPTPSWGLPGGRVEAGEVLTDALAREVREETGLRLEDPGRLAYTVQLDNPAGHVWVGGEAPRAGTQAVTFTFEVGAWSGEVAVADPDGFVLDCRFVPAPEAVRLLETTVPWAVMREPAAAYLRGEGAPGALWIFRRTAPDADQLILRLPFSPQ